MSQNLVLEGNNDPSYSMYLVSDTYLGDSKQVNPSIPKDEFTKKGIKDNKVERVVFYPSINSALIAAGSLINTNREMFVHVPVEGQKVKAVKPSDKLVPDKGHTGEIWVKEPIKVKCIGKIRIGKEGKEYEFEVNGTKYKEHSWNYSWLTKQDKHIVNDTQTESYIMEEYLSEDAINQLDGVINTGDTLILFQEDARNDAQLRRILYTSRMKTRKDVLNLYESVKKDNNWIKYTFPDLEKYKSKNVFVDTYYYTNIFFANNTWSMKKGLSLYTDFMSRLINKPIYKENGYKKKVIVFPVADWDTLKNGQLWNYRVSLNPLSVIYQFLFTNDMKSILKIFGDSDVLFVTKTKFFKINFSHLDPKDTKKLAQKFKLFLIKLAKNEEFDSSDMDTSFDHNDTPEVVQAKIVDKIEDSRGVDLTAQVNKAVKKAAGKPEPKEVVEKPDAPISKGTLNKPVKDIENDKTDIEAKKDNIADVIVQATINGKDEEDAIDMMDDTEVRNMLLDISGEEDSVNISAGRAARISALDKKFMDANVKGKTVRDILADDSSTKEVTTELKVDSPNEEWKEMSFVNFDKNYNIDKDILSIFHHFESVSRPIAIRKIDVEDTSTSEDRVETYRVEMEDYRGKQFTVKLDIPIMVDNRFLLRGNYKSIQTQFFNMPIIKTDLDTCQIISNYMKIFVRRFRSGEGRSLPITAMFIKACNKYTGKDVTCTTGDNSRICAKYNLPIDYIDIATVFNTIETKQFKFYFNQDELRKDHEVDLTIGLPIGYDKKSKKVVYATGDKNVVSDIMALIYEEGNKGFVETVNAMGRPTICTYSRASIMNSQIPLVLICAYHVGLRKTMDKAGIKYEIQERIPSEIRHDPAFDWIKFEDGYVIFQVDYNSSLLMNGLKECSTENHSISEIDDRNMYLEFLDDFGGRIKADGLDNFYDLMVDPIIKESLEFYKMPVDYIDILIYANNLLADNKFIKHTDTSSRKLRRYQLISVYTYKVLADAYATYANQVKHLSNTARFAVKQSAVIDKFLTDTITSDDSVINALRDVETTNAVTTKGPSGMNEDRSYSLDKRTYDESMLNVVGMSTGFAGNVGITRQATLNSNVTASGYVKNIQGDTSKMNDANTLTATEALTPFGSTHDDPFRTAMTFIQTSKHGVRTVDADPLLVTNGSDEAMPYITTDRFAFKAKKNGTIKEITEDYIIVNYADGENDFINLSETIEKNSDGGYFVPLKLDAVKNLKPGMKVKEGQILAYDKDSFANSVGESENLSYLVGKIAKIAIINSDEGFEDSGIISNSMAEKLATRVDYEYDVTLDKAAQIYMIAKVGDHVEAGQELMVWQNPFEDEDANALMGTFSSDEISELGKRKIVSKVTGTLKGIKIYRTVETSEMSNSLKRVVSEYEKPLRELAKKIKENNIKDYQVPAHYVLPATGKMKHAEGSVRIEFYVEYLDTIGVGDKIVYYSANKAVEKNIFPIGKEPYTDFRPNEKIDAFVSQVSIDKRMVASTILFGSLQKLMIELDRSVKDIMEIPYDDSTV